MMTNVFNTTFELSLRVLLTLDSSNNSPKTVDMITALDFITVYGKDFGISEENLHGDNSYRFCELAIRRELITGALKSLVLDGLVSVRASEKGFTYEINSKGKTFCNEMENTYAKEYREAAVKAQAFVSRNKQKDILKLINQQSLLVLQRGESNG
jgi:hypothetical protein